MRNRSAAFPARVVRKREVGSMSLARTLAGLAVLALLASCAGLAASNATTPRSDQSKYGP